MSSSVCAAERESAGSDAFTSGGPATRFGPASDIGALGTALGNAVVVVVVVPGAIVVLGVAGAVVVVVDVDVDVVEDVGAPAGASAPGSAPSAPCDAAIAATAHATAVAATRRERLASSTFTFSPWGCSSLHRQGDARSSVTSGRPSCRRDPKQHLHPRVLSRPTGPRHGDVPQGFMQRPQARYARLGARQAAIQA
jgi:hypothetical protein